jgi:hypothetical protein
MGFTVSSPQVSTSLRCIMVLDSNKQVYAVISPSFANNTVIRCPLSSVPDQMFAADQVIHVFVSQELIRTEQHGSIKKNYTQRYRSEYKSFQGM